jgi:hypothetical protein
MDPKALFNRRLQLFQVSGLQAPNAVGLRECYFQLLRSGLVLCSLVVQLSSSPDPPFGTGTVMKPAVAKAKSGKRILHLSLANNT